MKKNVFAVLVLLLLITSFFTACGDPNDPAVGGVTYTLTITGGPFSIRQGLKAAIGRSVTASDDSSTAGITFSYACTSAGHENCGVSINLTGSEISVAGDAIVGDHAFKATASKDGKTVATASFTVTVTEAAYGIEILQPITVKHGDDSGIINYTLTAPGNNTTGMTVSISDCEDHSPCGLSITNNASRSRFDIAPVPTTTAIGDHTFIVTVTKDSNIVASETIIIKVTPKYTLTTDESFQAERGSILTIPYTLTASDGSSTDGFTVGIFCTSDYEDCDLLVDQEWGVLDIAVPETATLNKQHGMKLQAENEEYQVLAEFEFVITVIAAVPVKVPVTPGAAVNVAASATSTAVTFTAASAVSGLTSADFTLSSGASFAAVNPVEIAGGTDITVNVTFAANTGAAKTFTVGIDPGSAKISGSGSVTITQAAAPTQYSLNVVITIDAGAPLEDGEVVWIAGSFYGTNWGDTGGTFLLTKQGDGTWTATVPNIPIARTTINYNVFADKSSTNFSWGPKASSDDLVLNDANTAGTLTYTVTEWIGRPILVEGNLITDPGFAAADWALSTATAWTFTGIQPALSAAWFKDTDPAPRVSGKFFKDFGWLTDPDGNRNIVGEGNTCTISQEVNASANGLAAGTEVTMSVWVYRNNDLQDEFKLLVGEQAQDVTDQLTADLEWEWEQLSYTFTLSAEDIAADKIFVGLSYKVLDTTTDTCVDDFYFGIAE